MTKLKMTKPVTKAGKAGVKIANNVIAAIAERVTPLEVTCCLVGFKREKGAPPHTHQAIFALADAEVPAGFKLVNIPVGHLPDSVTSASIGTLIEGELNGAGKITNFKVAKEEVQPLIVEAPLGRFMSEIQFRGLCFASSRQGKTLEELGYTLLCSLPGHNGLPPSYILLNERVESSLKLDS